MKKYMMVIGKILLEKEKGEMKYNNGDVYNRGRIKDM